LSQTKTQYFRILFSSLKRTYNNVAWIYDRLARLIYGRALIEAQLHLLKAIPPQSRILIAGGGTGWILEEITHIHPSGLNITYVDISDKMIALAAKRNIGKNKVTFINAPIQDLVATDSFDIIITPFLFDNFTDQNLPAIFSKLHVLLTPKGLWLYCDFQNTNVLWQKSLLKIMYLFFRLICGVEASHLPDASASFNNHGYQPLSEKTFLKDFIIAQVLQKR